MSEDPPLNWKRGVQQYGGDEEMYKLMIERFENLTFDQNLASLFGHVMKMDYKAIRSDANTIKGATNYLAADRCERIAELLEKAAINEHDEKIVVHFLSLMSEAKALKLHIAKLTNKTQDLSDIQKYEEDVRRQYPSFIANYSDDILNARPPSGCCTGCSIF